MRQSFLFALVIVILGAALYAVFFVEGGSEKVIQATSTTTTGPTVPGEAEGARDPVVPPGSASDGGPASSPVVHIGGVAVQVTTASTPEARSQGLSGRPGLAEDEGMLFIFPEDGIHSFWMKDMRFSIDILWLSEDGTVVHIEDDVSPESYPASFSSSGPARYVLEVPAGFAEAHNIAPGDRAVLPR